MGRSDCPVPIPVPQAQVLVPLAARYASWLGLPATAAADTGAADTGAADTGAEDTVAEESALVRVMPLILRIERDAAPARSALLEAAASAAVALCLDERAQPGGPWHSEVAPWVAGRIRKVTRRARGGYWRAVTELPGITIDRRCAQVRALLPWLVTQTPKGVTRLQVSGTEVPADDPGPPPDGCPVLWLAPQPIMTTGKAAAQVGHASMMVAALLGAQGRVTELDRWAADGYRVAVRTASAAQWTRLAVGQAPEQAWRERGVLTIRDAGYTEVAPGTVTVAAVISTPFRCA